MPRPLPLHHLLGVLLFMQPVARGGVIESGNPESLRDRQLMNAIRVTGRLSGYKLTDRYGRQVEVRLPTPARIEDPLTLPPGEWAELTLLPAGALRVAVGAGSPVALDVPALTVTLEDPEVPTVTLDWSLPDGVRSALRAGLAPAGLAEALADGALGRPR